MNTTAISDPKHPLFKYFWQRKRLFLRYDDGIQLNNELWFSVTPETIAAHIARRYASANIRTVVDLYSGAGGNTIQFAIAGLSVTGVEINRTHIDLAKNNALVYGVLEKITFQNCDVTQYLQGIIEKEERIAGLFLSPPWGGPKYIRKKPYNVEPFISVVTLARKVSNSVGILVPRNVCHKNVWRSFGPCEIETNRIGGVVKTKTIYFDHLDKKNVRKEE